MSAKLMDVNSGAEFTSAKPNQVMKAPSPLASGSKSPKAQMMDVNSGGYKEEKASSSGTIKASVSNGMKKSY